LGLPSQQSFPLLDNMTACAIQFVNYLLHYSGTYREELIYCGVSLGFDLFKEVDLSFSLSSNSTKFIYPIVDSLLDAKQLIWIYS
jgi:hypothetical protein